MLLSAYGLEGVPVIKPDKKKGTARAGRVNRVLFHPTELRAVGYEVDRPRLGYVVDRKPIYLALDSGIPRDDAVTVDVGGRDAWGSRAAKRIGVPWDETVVWRGMPVLTENGTPMGTVYDVIFAPDGPIRTVELSEGVTSDAALGRREIRVAHIVGFDGEAIRVNKEALDAEFEGGVAALAGRGTVVAADAAGKAAVAAGQAAGKAAAYGKAAAKVAAESDTAKKAKSWLKGLGAEVLDAMGPPEDDE